MPEFTLREFDAESDTQPDLGFSRKVGDLIQYSETGLPSPGLVAVEGRNISFLAAGIEPRFCSSTVCGPVAVPTAASHC